MKMIRTKMKTKEEAIIMGIPTIDLSMENRSELSEKVVKACEEFGIFKVENHKVPLEVVSRMEEEGAEFFAKPSMEKQQAGPPNPFGYGCKNIGNNGDVGELEYLLLHTNPLFISQTSKTISIDPNKFSGAVNDYIEGAKGVACEILELVVEGLGVQHKFALSNLIKHLQSDSVLRINHYPPNINNKPSIAFGEHSDPQILTIMRSNHVTGLQASTHHGLWITVPPDPTQFFVMVGDALQVFTNGRFRSVRHRVLLTNTMKARMSMMYFGAPPLNWWITPLPEIVSPPQNPSRYKPFTWGQYKKAAYSHRLGDCRLDQFKVHHDTPY
ncbi:Gibberellin 2-beta-dioxygenase 2 [Stylosanthes scabra]|uniref:Gibberellin 2-beta-dioxygenase 2 n=1 Tax=Stylosanthes scabra TaxID=79078 RepID=A0ABU6XBK3_9FABA|nr:Gibberellin 2-beta-dioxygenase 2 [Stylosanthes scabra]